MHAAAETETGSAALPAPEVLQLTQGGEFVGSMCSAWSASSQRLAIGCHTGAILIYNTEEPEAIHTFRPHTELVAAVAWDPAGRRLVSVSDDKTVCISDGISGAALHRISWDGEWASAVAWAPNAKRVALAGYAGHAYIWDIEKGVLSPIEFAPRPTACFAWSANGGRLLAAHPTAPAAAIGLGDGRTTVAHLHPPPALSASPLRQAAWSRDGQRLAFAADTGEVCIWSEREGTFAIHNIPAYSHAVPDTVESVHGIVWAADGSRYIAVFRTYVAVVAPDAGPDTDVWLAPYPAGTKVFGAAWTDTDEVQILVAGVRDDWHEVLVRETHKLTRP